jgi:signal transduction histidine kinase/ActR/RegA family two-component response regulator
MSTASPQFTLKRPRLVSTRRLRTQLERLSAQLERLRAHPFAVGLCLLLFFTVVFGPLYARLGDGAFVLSNLLPLGFAFLFGMRWGFSYAIVHSAWGVLLAGIAGLKLDRLASNGIPAIIVTVLLCSAIGRIRDLTRSLQHELKERRRYEEELQRHRTHLESLVAERTNDLVKSNGRLRQEIAERARAEIEKRELANSLKRAEKMEAIGLLAGSVAHDLNNMLSSIVLHPELLLLDLPADSPLREGLTAIHKSGKRAADLVADLLTMARRNVTTMQVLNVNDAVSSLVASAEFDALKARHREVRVETNLAPDLLNIQGSPVHLSRAILNLILNSMEAIEKGGRVTVSTANLYVDRPSGKYERVPEGEYATLTVEDSGAGIAPEDLDRIFEPFYTKKGMGHSGTGLGMAIVWGTVKDHNGFIDVRSVQGRGTTVTLFLPATRAQLQANEASSKVEDCLGNGESILIVDDIQMQRALCTSILTKLGYNAASVSSGEEAVEYIKHNVVDLLVLDMIMDSGIDGLETYERIVKIKPGQRAIITSGFSETERVRRAGALGAGSYVRKPYTFETIAVAVRNELRRRS